MFWKKRQVNQDVSDWAHAMGGWTIEGFGGMKDLSSRKLILPTPDFFPVSKDPDHKYAESILIKLKYYMGISNWQTELVQQLPNIPNEFDPSTFQKFQSQQPAGTFSVDPHGMRPKGTITYAPNLLQNPQSLIATLAHELAHYLQESCYKEPPGGFELHEPATDGLAIMQGYGIFFANTANIFDGHNNGWSFTWRGYLSNDQILYCHAIFLHLKRLRPELTLQHLNKVYKKRFKRIYDEIDPFEIIDACKGAYKEF